MARMYPSRLPNRVLENPKLKGEIKVYEALGKLSDEFDVFYNRCASANEVTSAYKRPIDFIVLHEKWGLLAIEVKGGKIRIGADGGVEQYHPSSREWASIDPYQQIKHAAIKLITSVKADGANYWIPDSLCVLFSDTLRRDITNMPHLLQDGTLCADDLGLLPVQIKTLFAKSRTGEAWPRDAFLDMRRRLQNMPEALR